MVIKQISEKWYSLESTCNGETPLLWFGYSRAEVMQKFRSYIRDRDLENVRYKPRGRR
jgi:hypothetical protein